MIIETRQRLSCDFSDLLIRVNFLESTHARKEESFSNILDEPWNSTHPLKVPIAYHKLAAHVVFVYCVQLFMRNKPTMYNK